MTEENTQEPTELPPQKLGVVIGRFQPFHTGHLKLIKKALKDCEKVLVLIGSCTKSPDYKNPLASATRRDMVLEVTHKLAGNDLYLLPIKDFPLDHEWVSEVIGYVNSFEEDPTLVTIYTSERDAEFYRTNFIYNLDVTLRDDVVVTGTDIRKEMYEDRTVSKDVPLKLRKGLREFMETAEFKRLKDEYFYCRTRKAEAELAHKFNNPIEPVCHALVIHRGNALLVRRNGIRGKGQLAMPGGFLQSNETTREAAIRELREETGIDLTQMRAQVLSSAVEENLNGLSVRTLGINYCFVIHEEEEVEVEIDPNEVQEVLWIPVGDVAADTLPLFYNHLTAIRRLLSNIPQEPAKPKAVISEDLKGEQDGQL